MISDNRYTQLTNLPLPLEFYGLDVYGEVIRVRKQKEICYVSCDLLAHGDYYGSTIEISNCQHLMGSVEADTYRLIEKRCNYEQVLLPLTGKHFKATLQVLTDLSEYSSLNDDLLSSIENDYYWGGWEDYGHDEFIKAVSAKFHLYLDASDIDENLSITVYESLLPSREYCLFEQGGHPSFISHIDFALENATETIVEELQQ